MKIASFSKTYEGTTVLDFSGLELEKGKIYGVIGANGSGKSTFAKILAGVIKADRRGKPVQAKVGYVPQKNYAFRMSVEKNLMLNGVDSEKTEQLLNALQLKPLQKKRADKLSGGETARMALARLMMGRYDLVILDEPTAAMDMETTLLAENLIVRYVQETGCALVLITHSLQQARRIANHVLYFHKGKMLEHGTAESMLHTPVQAETKQFLDFYGI